MPYYAQLNSAGQCSAVTETSGAVDSPNMIVLDALDTTLLGRTYDYALQQWSALTEAPESRHITGLAFRNRFTRAEKIAIELAALDDPSAPMAQRQASAALRADLKDQESATYIDLERADTRAGVQALEAAGLLAAGRALEILDAPVQAHERAKG